MLRALVKQLGGTFFLADLAEFESKSVVPPSKLPYVDDSRARQVATTKHNAKWCRLHRDLFQQNDLKFTRPPAKVLVSILPAGLRSMREVSILEFYQAVSQAPSNHCMIELSQDVDFYVGWSDFATTLFRNTKLRWSNGKEVSIFALLTLQGFCVESFPNLGKYTVRAMRKLIGQSFNSGPVAAILISAMRFISFPKDFESWQAMLQHAKAKRTLGMITGKSVIAHCFGAFFENAEELYSRA